MKKALSSRLWIITRAMTDLWFSPTVSKCPENNSHSPLCSKLHDFRLSLLGKDISPIQSAKDLGVILDSNLAFDDHIKTTVSECIARLAQISRVKHCLDRTSLLTVINALVFSKLYYCSNVWANTTEKNIRKLQAVQNYACRIVSGARKYDHVTPHLKSLSWLPIKDQLYYRQATMAFKCISGHAPKYLTSQFITREQLGVAKSLIYLFLKQPQDKEHFITELLDFGTI